MIKRLKSRFDIGDVSVVSDRGMKSILDTRPIFHQRDETIRGHVFCSFLALILRKELVVLKGPATIWNGLTSRGIWRPFRR